MCRDMFRNVADMYAKMLNTSYLNMHDGGMSTASYTQKVRNTKARLSPDRPVLSIVFNSFSTSLLVVLIILVVLLVTSISSPEQKHHKLFYSSIPLPPTRSKICPGEFRDKHALEMCVSFPRRISGESFGRGPGLSRNISRICSGKVPEIRRRQWNFFEPVLNSFGTLGWEKLVGCFELFWNLFFELQLCW